MTMQQFTANNYLVPASGRVHGAKYSNNFGSVTSEDVINWGTYKINNFPFIPQGAFINNTEGTDDLTIIIEEIDYKILVPAGIAKQAQFPAIEKSTFTISAQGKVSIFFVDFPVLPDSGLVNIGNQVSVNLSGFSFSGSLPVLPAVNNAGIPYQITNIRTQGESKQATITGSNLSASIVPASGNYINKITVDFLDNSTITLAGVETVIIKSGTLVIYSGAVYLGTASGASNRQKIEINLDDIKLGAAGDTISVTIGTALATGSAYINAYFSGV